MKNKKRNKVMLLVVLLLALSIGFAALSTTLKINGTANIGKNSWNVYWDNVANKTGVTPVSGPTIGNDSQGGVNTQVTFEVNLNEPGDFYEFTVDAVNAGTLDAMITGIAETLNGNPVTSQNKLPDYIKFDVTYADGIEIGQYHLLPKATVSGNTTTPTVETYKVRIEYDRDAVDNTNLPASDTTYTLTYSITYSQADEHAIPKPIKAWTLPQGKTANTLSVGDEICLANDNTQCFNFIKYDNNDIVMLAKYNLKVGYIYNNSWTKTGDYTSSDPGYNKQSSETRGYIYGASTCNGTVPFSVTNYWDDDGSPKSDYPGSYSGPDYPTVYDATNYSTEPDFSNECDYDTNCWETAGYSIAYYVEAYKDILEDSGATIKNARLLTYSEATDSSIGCDENTFSCPTNGFITNTSFWLGSANGYEILWFVESDGNFQGSYYRYDDTHGVRPVIVVEKSNL